MDEGEESGVFEEEKKEKGFLKEEYRKILIVENKVDNLLDQMDRFEPLKNDKWFEV